VASNLLAKEPRPTKNFNRKIKTRTLQKPPFGFAQDKKSAAPERAKTYSSLGLAIRPSNSGGRRGFLKQFSQLDVEVQGLIVAPNSEVMFRSVSKEHFFYLVKGEVLG
jgi:hypothetical protein